MGVTLGACTSRCRRGRSDRRRRGHDKLGADSSFTDEDVRLAESLAVRAATAVDLSERVSRDAVRRVVEAQETSARDSHASCTTRPARR